jgi:hypothetical protein
LDEGVADTLVSIGGERPIEMKAGTDQPHLNALNDEIHLSGIAIHQRLVGPGSGLTLPTRRVGEEHPTCSVQSRNPPAPASHTQFSAIWNGCHKLP